MSSFRVSKRVAFVSLLAVFLAGTVGMYRVYANGGLSGDIGVNIFEPVNSGNTLSLTAYTEGAAVPPSIPIGVRTVVEDGTFRGTSSAISSVRTVLGGEFSEGSITGEAQSVQATAVNTVGDETEYIATVDASLLEFEEPARGDPGVSLFASDIIRTVAIAEGYYSRTVSDIGEFDEIGIQVAIRDLDEVDTDGNLIPNATALLERFLLLFDEAGNVTIVLALDDLLVRGESLDYELTVQTVQGPMDVTIVASSLDDIIAESGGALAAFNTGRLIVTLSSNPAETLDGPSGVDPLGEFDLEDDIGPLPPPQNLFARVNVALASVARGAAPSWTFLEVLPGDAFFSLQVGGPGIAEILQDGFEVGAYTYDVELTQSGENITAEGEINPDGWVDISDDVSLFNLDNADDDDDARLVIADDGDDTIAITSNNVSAIYGSNAVPRVGSSGGGSSSLCFIATAAYGTPMAAEIGALRGVRDRFMLTNLLGSTFADTYYRLSPPIAGEVAQSETLRQAVRTALLPVVAMSQRVLASPGIAALALIALAGFGAAALRRRRA